MTSETKPEDMDSRDRTIGALKEAMEWAESEWDGWNHQTTKAKTPMQDAGGKPGPKVDTRFTAP